MGRGRDFAVSDIHGCFSHLSRSLKSIGSDASVDRLFSVGDLVDRGTESDQVLPWLNSVLTEKPPSTLRYNDYKYLNAMATSIRLDPETEQRLVHLAARTGRTKAYYLRELVTNGLEDLEDFYLASATMERVRKGEEPVYSLEEAERNLGLAD